MLYLRILVILFSVSKIEDLQNGTLTMKNFMLNQGQFCIILQVTGDKLSEIIFPEEKRLKMLFSHLCCRPGIADERTKDANL